MDSARESVLWRTYLVSVRRESYGYPSTHKRGPMSQQGFLSRRELMVSQVRDSGS